jgi:hypothetical protein
MSFDEVTTIDCHGWIIVHVYVVEGWKHIPILLTLEQVLFGVTTNNLTNVIVANLLQYGGHSKTNLASKLIKFGVDVLSVF